MYKLNDLPLFSTLDENQISELQAAVQVRKYEKDSIVFYEGDESKYLYILLDGIVRLYKTNPKGKQIHMHNFEAPEAIALFVAFEKMPFPASCEFLTEGAIGLLPLEKFHDCLNDSNFSKALVVALAKRMKMLATLLHKETIYSSEAKIADLLHNNPSVFERLKNTEIAAMLNMTPETLSRTLSKLKKENIITADEHIVTILDEAALLNIVETNTMKRSVSV